MQIARNKFDVHITLTSNKQDMWMQQSCNLPLLLVNSCKTCRC